MKSGKQKHSGRHGISRRKLWSFRLGALFGIPVVLCCLLEIGMRLCGYGYPTAFLISATNHGEKTYVQNNQFGWRFFGRQMSRQPHPISISREKHPGTIRIFVFGESAAFGDPQPRYGLPRMIQAMLELRHPGTRFEVVNAAMTGISSHAILPIARDCANAGGDIWVIYMGNNEVVGPFGAGTVFGPQTLALPVIRTAVALKTARTAQLLDSIERALDPPPPSKSEWGGMMMFLDHRVRADDPRLDGVYRNFSQNLDDILRTGVDHGAKIVLSTVAVNLRDCAPFASLNRADLKADQKTNWEMDYRRGEDAVKQGNYAAAESSFQAAAAIDDTYAELSFYLGQCALAQGRKAEASRRFAAARDLDALRFRCDSKLNSVIRQIGAKYETKGVRMVDAEKAFADASPDGIAGADWFYEHVHLKFAGNYLLARIITADIEPMISSGVGAAAAAGWPDVAACADRLARTHREEAQGTMEVLGRLTDPPFTGQLDHAAQVERLEREARDHLSKDASSWLRQSTAACETALSKYANDPLLYQQLAELKQESGDYPAMAAAAQHSLDLLPSNTEAWLQLGVALAQSQKYDEAAQAFRNCFAIDPQDVWGRQNLAICYKKMGRREESLAELKRALKIEPRFGMAWLEMGQVYESMGQTNVAADCYQNALANPVHRASELTTLAQFCQSRQWHEPACTNFARAIKLSPADPSLRMGLGLSLAALKRHEEAARSFDAAASLAPNLGQAYFLSGVQYGAMGNPAKAEEGFRQAVRLLPGMTEAQANLGIALFQQKKFGEAREIFDRVLRSDPSNPTALKYIQALLSQPQ